MKVNRNYLSLWALLAVGLAALVGYDAYCESDEGEHLLRPSRILRAMGGGGTTADAGGTQASAPGCCRECCGCRDGCGSGDGCGKDSCGCRDGCGSGDGCGCQDGCGCCAIDAAAGLALAAPVDTMPKNILFIGDSMLEGLSPRLAAYCKASGHTLRTVIWYSSTSEIWGNARLLSRYIAQIHPDYIFICLGGNELFVRDIIDKRDRHVKSIIAEIGDIPYLWIGPPNWKEDTGINYLIEHNAEPGCYFCSNGMTFQRKKDGAHPTAESAIEWMDSVVRWMPAHCAHPIIMNEPSTSTARPAKVYIHQPGTNP